MKRRIATRLTTTEDGVALILALIFIMVVGVVIAALLPYTQTGIAAAAAVRDVRTVQNADDGAVDGAINSIRGSLSEGQVGKPCPTYTAPPFPDPIDPTNASKAVTVTVTCTGVAGGHGPSDTEPPYAIQTLSRDINITGNAPLDVQGSVFSAGNILIGNPQQGLAVTSGDVYAKGNCESPISVDGVEHCANTTPPYAVNDPDGADPYLGISEPISTSADIPSTVDPYGTCANSTSVVKFAPGYYSETPTPDPTTCAGNQHNAWWFTPGLYYFDFPDSRFPTYTDNNATWNIGNIAIVGGTPAAGWAADPAATSASTVTSLIGSACDDGQPGVDFVFGGPTNIAIASGNLLELCGTNPPGSNQIVSLWGLRGGAARDPSGTTGQGTPTEPATNPSPPVGAAFFTNQPAGRKIDATSVLDVGNLATAALSGLTNALSSASMDLGTFLRSDGTTPVLPDGSLILSATLTVSHAESSTQVTPRISVTSPAGLSFNKALTNSPSLSSDTVTIPLSGPLRWKQLQKLKVTYTADGSNLHANPTPDTATAYLDGMELDVKYVTPAPEATHCPGAIASTGCLLLNNTVDDAVFFHGTVYTPRADLLAQVHNFSTTVFRRGVITGGIQANVSPSTKQTEAPFQLPGELTSRRVLFEATPAGSNRPRLRALVEYTDFAVQSDGKSVSDAGRSVRVLEWTVLP